MPNGMAVIRMMPRVVNVMALNALNAMIHARGDGRRIRRAFTYDWRMYTLPELKDALLEAGFGDMEVWSEGWDATGKHGNGTLYKRTRLDHSDTWVAYVVATR